VAWCSGGDKLDQDIFDAMTEFIGQILQRGERLADSFDVPVSCMKAIHRVEGAVTMKDLGRLMHCDPSFVTMIADALEERGLARREPNPADRRIKNLVLTEHGREVKAAIEQAMLERMPWALALDSAERQQLLDLIRKMSRTMAAGEVTTPSPASA
jgi:DNA-binding MarR family transcriptional regulator